MRTSALCSGDAEDDVGDDERGQHDRYRGPVDHVRLASEADFNPGYDGSRAAADDDGAASPEQSAEVRMRPQPLIAVSDVEASSRAEGPVRRYHQGQGTAGCNKRGEDK